MRFSIFTLLAAASAVSAQSTTAAAPQVTDSPEGAAYKATLQKGTVHGNLQASTVSGGKGVSYQLQVYGLPEGAGPFMYHIHEKPVPADGNCTGTGAHLDPYKRGETPACDASKPETCQVGDLSGKYGNFTHDDSKTIVDPFTSTNPSDISYIGNLSIVIHSSNKTRLACANLTVENAGEGVTSLPVGTATAAPSNGTIAPTGTGASTILSTVTASTFHSGSPTQPSAPSGTQSSKPTNAAGKPMAAGAAVLAGVMGMLL